MPYNKKWFEDINKQLFELRLKIDSNNKDINRRDAYITSLDDFIKKNPKIKGIPKKVKFDITKMWPNDTLWLVKPSNRYK